MKGPICDICLNSDMLCRACMQLLNSGKISQADIDVSRAVSRLSKKMKGLKDVTIEKALDFGDIVIIICRHGEASQLVGRDGSTAMKLSKEIGKRVKIIEGSEDPKDFIRNLLLPARVRSVSILYTPEGETYKVLVGKGSRIPLRAETLNRIALSVLGKGIRVTEG